MSKPLNVVGAICIGALSNQHINEVTIVREGSYDPDDDIWWVNGTALVFRGGSIRNARAHSINWSADSGDWIGGRILPLLAETAYPSGGAQ